jgi:endonuclease III
MKNATKHADSLKSLAKKTVRDFKPVPLENQEPVRAIVRAILSFNAPDGKVDEAMKIVDREFVDLNELRVATELEVQEMIGSRYPEIEKRSMMISQILNSIFEREHTMHLNRLAELGKREIRQYLREMPEQSPFVEAYVMLFCFDGHAFPMDEEIHEFLTDEGVLEEQTSIEDAQKFVEHHLKAEECYEFFAALRKGLHEGGLKKKKKAKA